MDSPDQYAVKGHDLMRKAQKVLKGIRHSESGSFFGNLTTNKS